MTALLADKRILITSGPTRANIDAVRYVSNRSSGRLGCRIAVEALRRGAEVTLINGPGAAAPRDEDLSVDERARLRMLRVETVFDLIGTLQDELARADALDAIVHAMAVLDYVPESSEDEKRPSGQEGWRIRLMPTPKVIDSIRGWAPGALLVGFKLEAREAEEALRQAALAVLRRSGADLIVANDLARIHDETHPAIIVDPDGEILARPSTKAEIASALCDILAERLA